MVNLTKIKELRKEHKVTGNALAEMLDIKRVSYFHKESGMRGFKVEELCVLAKLYNIKVDDLLIY